MRRPWVLSVLMAASLLGVAPVFGQACHNNVVILLDESPSMARYRAEALTRIAEFFGDTRAWPLDNPEHFTVWSFGKGDSQKKIEVETTPGNRTAVRENLDDLRHEAEAQEAHDREGGIGETDFRKVLTIIAAEMRKGSLDRNFFIIASDFVHDVKTIPGHDEVTSDLLSWRKIFADTAWDDLKANFKDPGKNVLILLESPPIREGDEDRQSRVASDLAGLVLPRRAIVKLGSDSEADKSRMDADLGTFLMPLWLEPHLHEDRSLDITLHNTACSTLRVKDLVFQFRPDRGSQASLTINIPKPVAVHGLNELGKPPVITLSRLDLEKLLDQQVKSAYVAAQGCLGGGECRFSEPLSTPQNILFHSWIYLGPISGEYEAVSNALRLRLGAWGHVSMDLKEARINFFEGRECSGKSLGRSSNIVAQFHDLKMNQQQQPYSVDIDVNGGTGGVCNKGTDLASIAVVDANELLLSNCRELRRTDDSGHESASDKPHQLLEHVSLPLIVAFMCVLGVQKWKGSIGGLADALTIFLVVGAAAFGIFHAFKSGWLEDYVANHLQLLGYLSTFALFVLLFCGFQLGLFDSPKSLETLRAESSRPLGRARYRRQLFGMGWLTLIILICFGAILSYCILSGTPGDPCKFDCLPQEFSSDENQ